MNWKDLEIDEAREVIKGLIKVVAGQHRALIRLAEVVGPPDQAAAVAWHVADAAAAMAALGLVWFAPGESFHLADPNPTEEP
jgi:hypothetical protein